MFCFRHLFFIIHITFYIITLASLALDMFYFANISVEKHVLLNYLQKEGRGVEIEPKIYFIHLKSHNSQYSSLALIQDLARDCLTMYYHSYLMNG